METVGEQTVEQQGAKSNIHGLFIIASSKRDDYKDEQEQKPGYSPVTIELQVFVEGIPVAVCKEFSR